jgi:hypothetical protein
MTGVDPGYQNLPRVLVDVNGDWQADYCRFVGESPNIFLSCNLATGSGLSSSQYTFNSISGIDLGYDDLPRLLGHRRVERHPWKTSGPAVLHERGNLHELDARAHTVETGNPRDEFVIEERFRGIL